jgi:hypothetical protein
MSRLLTEQQTLREIDSNGRRSAREFIARQYAEQERAEVRDLLADLDSELATLAPARGKKPSSSCRGLRVPAGYAMASYALGRSNFLTLEAAEFLPGARPDRAAANAAEITFYTVDARGLEAEGVSASNDDPFLARPGVSFIAREDSQQGS